MPKGFGSLRLSRPKSRSQRILNHAKADKKHMEGRQLSGSTALWRFSATSFHRKIPLLKPSAMAWYVVCTSQAGRPTVGHRLCELALSENIQRNLVDRSRRQPQGRPRPATPLAHSDHLGY